MLSSCGDARGPGPQDSGQDAARADGGPIVVDSGAPAPDSGPMDAAMPLDAGRDAATAGPVPLVVMRTMIGTPGFEPVGCQQFTGTLGSAGTGFAEGFATLSAMLSPGHMYQSSTNTYVPATAHAPPYDTELSTALAAMGGVSRADFHAADFSVPQGIFLMCMLVPIEGAPTGSSSDFSSGPIIATSAFPFSCDADLYRDGVLFDPEFDSSWTTPTSGTGVSHAPLSFGESMAFAPSGVTDPRGDYQWRIHVVDAAGNGWNMTIDWTIAD